MIDTGYDIYIKVYDTIRYYSASYYSGITRYTWDIKEVIILYLVFNSI